MNLYLRLYSNVRFLRELRYHPNVVDGRKHEPTAGSDAVIESVFLIKGPSRTRC